MVPKIADGFNGQFKAQTGMFESLSGTSGFSLDMGMIIWFDQWSENGMLRLV
jgi:hypothetical protein